eukprot:154212-Rhodomonas_salina.1
MSHRAPDHGVELGPPLRFSRDVDYLQAGSKIRSEIRDQTAEKLRLYGGCVFLYVVSQCVRGDSKALFQRKAGACLPLPAGLLSGANQLTQG